MWNFEILGVKFYHLAAWLYLYSFLGWLWESSFISIKEKKLVNRGFVFGPFCTIYGVGAVCVYLVLKPFANHLVVLFLGGVLVPTILEYITSIVMEYLFHASWWDYSQKKFNFQGRICLGSSLAWGVFTIIMFRILQPFVIRIVSLVDVTTGQILICILTFLYVIDFSYASIGATSLGRKIQRMEYTVADLALFFQQTKIYTSTEEFLEKLEPYGKSFNKENRKEKIEMYQKNIIELLKKRGLMEYKDDVTEKFKEISERVTAFTKGSRSSRRLMRSYPNLGRNSILHKIKSRYKKLKGSETKGEGKGGKKNGKTDV